MYSEIIVFSGNAHRELAAKICDHLDTPIGNALVSQFSDGETRVEIRSNVRGKNVYIIQPTCPPVNHNVMESLIIIDACRRASARTITLVAPYFGYGRQERKAASRTPISAKVVADLYEAMGINRLVTVELHNSAIQGFFTNPVDHLFIKPVLTEFFQDIDQNTVVVSPDAGGVERARAMAKKWQCGLVIIDKRRDRPNESSVVHIIGDVSNKRCIIIDDIVDTGGSLVHACNALMDKGAKSVEAAITHPVLSGNAVQLINQSRLKRLVVSDTIPLSEAAQASKKIEQISVSRLLAESIIRIDKSLSISSLFQ